MTMTTTRMTDLQQDALSEDPAGAIDALLNDPLRMAEVLRAELLDSGPEEVFDRITRIAARITGAPVTFFSVLDTGRDYYKSCFGFGEPLASSRELEGRTFCHHAAMQEEPLVIPDTRADPVFRTVPTVETLGIAAYLGVPIRTAAGHVIGSLCAVAMEPRAWSEDDVAVMTELAASTVREVELREALREAERNRVARARLVRGFSHDLKNPIGAATGHAELLSDGFLGDLLPRQMESVSRIRSLLRDAVELIDDMVELARAEVGDIAPRPERLEIRALLDDMVAEYRPQMDASRISLDHATAVSSDAVVCDARRVRQILGNLLSNAIKYNVPDGRVELRVFDAPAGDVGLSSGKIMLAFEVEDTGIGIAAEHRPQMFTEFGRFAPEVAQGAGLGLAISRRIARALGGDLTYRPAPDSGSVFTLWIPVEQAP